MSQQPEDGIRNPLGGVMRIDRVIPLRDPTKQVEKAGQRLPSLNLETSCCGRDFTQQALCPPPPDVPACQVLWDRYDMPPHIRAHCCHVAAVAATLAAMLKDAGAHICVQTVLAAGLLHDLGKAYSLKYGSSHCQIGAAWVMRETRNQQVAQAVYHHVNWMWEVDAYNDAHLPALLITYADKRVKHDQVVSLAERFSDLLQRYGKTEEAQRHIATSLQQGRAIESALSKRLGVLVHESTFDSRWLVAGEGSIA